MISRSDLFRGRSSGVPCNDIASISRNLRIAGETRFQLALDAIGRAAAYRDMLRKPYVAAYGEDPPEARLWKW